MFTFIAIVFFLTGAIKLAWGYFKRGKSDFWNKIPDPVQRRRVIIGYLVFSAIVIAIAHFIDGDSAGPKAHDRVVIGEVFHSSAFDIVVHNMTITDRLHINTGNKFIDVKEADGSKYLVINLTFKNNAPKSTYIGLGTLKIDDNGTIVPILQGRIWRNGLNSYDVDPLTSKTADLVFQFPTGSVGEIYWHPEEQGNNKDIYLGEIKEKHVHVHVPE